MKEKFVFIIMLVLALSSCKNYLDVQPQGKVIPKTDEEFAAIIHNIVNSIEGGEDQFVVGNFEGVILYESFSDNLDANVKVGNLAAYVGDKINMRQAFYKNLFSIIRDCNIVLENISNRETELAKKTTAAAYAIKGICYYNLIRDYCQAYDPDNASNMLGMPIIDKFDMEEMPSRASLDVTVDYCASLLNKSAEYHIKDGFFLFTEDIVKTYLAKLYFWKEEWSSVVSLCEELLSKPQFALCGIADYEKMIQAKNASSGEVIVRSHINNNSDIDWYYVMIIKDIKTRPVSSSLVGLFDSDGDKDIRKGLSFDKKRINQKTISAKVRSSELVLMLAESYYHLNNQESALVNLNYLRRNRISDVEDYTMSNLPPVHSEALIAEDAKGKPLTPLISAIFDERRKEFYMEGDRWFELKRNGSPEFWVINNGLKYTTKEYLYTAPIYKSDVYMNSNMKQNNGYEN
jgi:starch-binding outer membrane protein, SusD/RagB family